MSIFAKKKSAIGRGEKESSVIEYKKEEEEDREDVEEEEEEVLDVYNRKL